MSYTIKTISINDIHVNVLNPRYEPQQNEIKEMELIINQGKILGLIRDIAKYGLDPSENLIVSYDKELEAYVSEEGNRRLTAIKLLKNPEITPAFTKNRDKFISKIFEIKSEFPNSSINKVNCVIFKDSLIQDHFIELKHTGENDGAGRISWDRESQIRFSKDKNPFNLYLLEFLQKMFPKQTSFYTSTVETRIISDPNFRKIFDMQISKNPPNIKFNSRNGYNRFHFVIEGLISKKFNVGDFYLKEDRETFISKHFYSIDSKDSEGYIDLFNLTSDPMPNEFEINHEATDKEVADVELTDIEVTDIEVTDIEVTDNLEVYTDEIVQSPDSEINDTEDIDHDYSIVEPPNISQISNKELVNIGRPYKNITEYNQLTKAIPFKNKYRKNLRINQNLRELSNIEYKTYPVATMFLLRSLLESYVNDYIDCFASKNNELKMKGISPKREKRNKKLRELLYDDIYTHLKNVIKDYASTYELIRVTFTENNNAATTQIINHYVHSATNYPDSSEILDTWQKISTVISSLDTLLDNHSANL
jgi:hypothetical protein